MKKNLTWSTVIEENILRVYNAATDAERSVGLNWYASAHSAALTLAERHNVTCDIVCGVIAALSPGNEWGKNLLDADTLLSAWNAGKPLPMVGTYGMKNVVKCRRILLGEHPLDVLPPATSPKVRAFYKCLSEPTLSDAVTIDRHAKCLALNAMTNRESISVVRPVEYVLYAWHYMTLATRIGLLPSQLQAITWITWHRLIHETDQLTFDDTSFAFGANVEDDSFAI
jgi:hypothetical protein